MDLEKGIKIADFFCSDKDDICMTKYGYVIIRREEETSDLTLFKDGERKTTTVNSTSVVSNNSNFYYANKNKLAQLTYNNKWITTEKKLPVQFKNYKVVGVQDGNYILTCLDRQRVHNIIVYHEKKKIVKQFTEREYNAKVFDEPTTRVIYYNNNLFIYESTDKLIFFHHLDRHLSTQFDRETNDMKVTDTKLPWSQTSTLGECEDSYKLIDFKFMLDGLILNGELDNKLQASTLVYKTKNKEISKVVGTTREGIILAVKEKEDNNETRLVEIFLCKELA